MSDSIPSFRRKSKQRAVAPLRLDRLRHLRTLLRAVLRQLGMLEIAAKRLPEERVLVARADALVHHDAA